MMTLREWLAFSGFRAAAALAFCLLPITAQAEESACIASTGQESPATGAGNPGSICPEEIAPMQVFRDCDVCPELIALPMGEFMMGAPEEEYRRVLYFAEGAIQLATPENPYVPAHEGPQQKVVVDIPIAMGKNEITWDEWMACVDDGGCKGYIPDKRIGKSGTDEAVIRSLTSEQFKHLPSRDAMLEAVKADAFFEISGRYPVVNVSVEDARAYVDWLNRKLGIDAYRLPTEAEWEYAARAGTTTRFAQGYEPTPDQANISGETTAFSEQRDRPDLRTLPFPVPVDEMDAANPWGLRHMSGNVAEITLSCFTARLQPWATTSEWLKKSFGENCERVSRGGSNQGPMDFARVAWRQRRPDDATRTQYTGFRIVKELN
jgi:formylglycine-generating enzyme required for sulfatase activity